MKYLYLILLLAVAASFTSCKTIGKNKTASTASNPYQSNPYYGPAKKKTSDYSSTASSSKYPSYSDSTYTPPTSSTTAPVPTYSSNTYTPSASSNSGSGGSHTVSKGENLFRISLKHNTSIAAIRQANSLSGDTIHPGQVLTIPGG